MSFTLHPQLEADSAFVRDLPLSQLRLMNQNAVPWLLLVPRREETEIYQLPPESRAQLMQEIAQTSKIAMQLFKPDKLNVAALGNMVPQLHIHIIARFKTDPAWPQPVWGKLGPSPYVPTTLANIGKRLNDDALWD